MPDNLDPSALSSDRLVAGMVGGGGSDRGRQVWVRLRTVSGADLDLAINALHLPLLIDGLEQLGVEAARLRRTNGLEPSAAPLLPLEAKTWEARRLPNGGLELEVLGANGLRRVLEIPALRVKALLIALTRALAAPNV